MLGTGAGGQQETKSTRWEILIIAKSNGTLSKDLHFLDSLSGYE